MHVSEALTSVKKEMYGILFEEKINLPRNAQKQRQLVSTLFLLSICYLCLCYGSD